MAGGSARQTKVTSSHWGAFEVDVEGDRIVATRAFSHDPDPSGIPDILPAAVHHRTRVRRPSIRRGWLESRRRDGRGTDDYVELSWDDALDIAAEEIGRVCRDHGNEAIFGGSYGWSSAGRFHHAQSQAHRFLNSIGGYVASFGSYSTGCAQSIMPHVFGVNFLKLLYEHQDGWQTLHEHTETLVMFGGINPKNSQVSMGGITEHETAGWFDRFAARGMRCINVGPQRADAPEGCEWLPVRPGSDTALMLALGLHTSGTLAQEDDYDLLEEIVIIGTYQKSLQSSLDRKRDANSIIEALSAEDIGQLPDVSITESLARLPGMAQDRDRGNGSQMSIRGAGGQLGLTTLNGREVAILEENRNIRYDQFPSELINTALIYKSPIASLAEGGLSGTVDLKTVAPLDYDERVVSVNFRGSMQELASGIDDAANSGMGTRYSVAYIDKFADDTLGVALGISGQDQPIGTQRAELWNYGDTWHNTQWNDEQGKNVNAPWGGSALVRGGSDERLGTMAVIAWEPTETFSLNYDFFYSRLDINETQRGFDFQIDPAYERQWEILDSIDSQYSNSDAGTVDLLSGRVGLSGLRNLNEHFTQTDTLQSHGVALEWNTESWVFDADLSHSSADRDRQWTSLRTINTSDDLYATFGANRDGRMTFILDDGISLTDFSQNAINQIEVRPLASGSDAISALALNAKYLFRDGMFTSLAFGTRLSQREKSVDAQRWEQFTLNEDQITSDLILNAAGEDYWNDLPEYLALDLDAVTDRYFGTLENPTPGNHNDLLGSWVVNEDIAAAFVQLNLDTSIAGMPVSGNVGVRWARTDTATSSHQITPAVWLEDEDGVWNEIPAQAIAVNTEHDYTDVLPSLNLNLGVTQDSQVRLAVAKTIARAPLDWLSPALDLGQDQWGANPGESGSGNPYLEPFRANQADLSYEWYFAENSSVSATLFYKDMESFISREAGADTVEYEGTEYTVSLPVNGSGGYIRGYELMYQQPLSFLPDYLKGLGIYANYAFTESNITQGTPLNTTPFGLTGLSEHVGTATLWYYLNGFETRVSYNYRSEFQRDINRVEGVEGVNADEGYVDLSMSYQATDNLRLLLQVQNLTDEPYEVYGLESNNPYHINKYEEFGRRFNIGFNWKL